MFVSFCHLLNRMGLSWLAAAMRWLCFFVLPKRFGRYANPNNVGYRGWISVPRLGPLAFVRLDGTLQFRW